MTILRRLVTSVQSITKRGGLTPDESKLTRDLVVGISQTGSCHLSATARVLHESCPPPKTEKRLSEGLAAPDSGLDELPRAYLRSVAPVYPCPSLRRRCSQATRRSCAAISHRRAATCTRENSRQWNCPPGWSTPGSRWTSLMT